MADDSGRVSGERWNELVTDIMKRFYELVEYLEEALLADGYPPFSAPVSEREQYATLIAMRDSGHPDFWANPQAVKDLARLSRRFGNPPEPVVGAFGETSGVRSPVTLLEGYL